MFDQGHALLVLEDWGWTGVKLHIKEAWKMLLVVGRLLGSAGIGEGLVVGDVWVSEAF